MEMIGEKNKCLASADYLEDYRCKYTHKPCIGDRFYGLNKKSLSQCPMYQTSSRLLIETDDMAPNINVTPNLVHDVIASAKKEISDIGDMQSSLERALTAGQKQSSQ